MSNSNAISRRWVLGFLAALTATPVLAKKSFGIRSSWQKVVGAIGLGSDSSGLARYQHAAIGLPDGRMVVTGGYRVSAATRSRSVSAPLASVQIYDPGSGSWTDLAPMLTPRARHAACLLSDGRIAVVGGIFANGLSSIEIYDPSSDSWSEGGALPYPMVDLSATASNSSLIVSGGQNGTPALTIPIPLRGAHSYQP